MNAPIADLSEYRLHRDCERIAYRVAPGIILVELGGEAHRIRDHSARELAEALNDALSRVGQWAVLGWVISRLTMAGNVSVRLGPTRKLSLTQEQAELTALALARLVGQ